MRYVHHAQFLAPTAGRDDNGVHQRGKALNQMSGFLFPVGEVLLGGYFPKDKLGEVLLGGYFPKDKRSFHTFSYCLYSIANIGQKM